MPAFKHVVIISDGIRGHFHQSLGVARWLKRLGGVEIKPVILVPKLSGVRKLVMMKILVRKLIHHDDNYSRDWLRTSGLVTVNLESNTLFVSTGSTAAPYCLALAKSTGNKSAVIMTPSVLGTTPFDFAIVPEHDKHDPNDKHVITTLGAPNHIYIPDLKAEAQKFFAGIEFTGRKIIALLIGGSDSNYDINPQWACEILKPLAEIHDADILITTSRRTGNPVDAAIEKIFADNPRVKYLLLASREPDVNPIPAMLGKATHVLVSEDSVSMVSEASTAGFRVGLIRVPRVTGKIKNFMGFGAARFDELFRRMRDKNLLEDLGDSPDYEKFLAIPEQKHNSDFNEAKRAAEWILNES